MTNHDHVQSTYSYQSHIIDRVLSHRDFSRMRYSIAVQELGAYR